MAKKKPAKEDSSKLERDKLNDKQLAFCKEYLKDFNATQAALRAGYSENATRQIASELLSKPDIQHQIQLFADELNSRADNDIVRIINELQLIAFGSLRDVADWNPDGLYIKDSSILEGGKDKLVSEVKEHRGEKGTSVSIKLHDKMKALELLGRYHKIFTDKIEVIDMSQLSDEELLRRTATVMRQLESSKT